MAQIDDTIATYLTAIDVEGKTPNTVLSYRASLEDFRRVGRRFGFPDELEAYSVEHVYRFLGDLKERGASPAYRHRRHREVKTFFSWCRRMEYVEANVFAKVALVKLDQQIRPPFSPDEIQRLLGSLDRSDLPGCRNHARLCQDSGLDPDFTARPGRKLPRFESESSRRQDQIGAVLTPSPES